jgi:hypothetical protein
MKFFSLFLVLFRVASNVPIVLAQGENPTCYVCGDASRVVTNPDVELDVPENFQEFTNGSKVTCQQVQDAGLLGMLPDFLCSLISINPVFQEPCGCMEAPTGVEEEELLTLAPTTTEEDDIINATNVIPRGPADRDEDLATFPPTYLEEDSVINGTDVIFNSTDAPTSNATTAPTGLAFVSEVSPAPSSAAPSDAPSVAPSDAPSLAPSDAPSLAPSDAPSFSPSAMPSDSPSVSATEYDDTNDVASNVTAIPSDLGTESPTTLVQPDEAETPVVDGDEEEETSCGPFNILCLLRNGGGAAPRRDGCGPMGLRCINNDEK